MQLPLFTPESTWKPPVLSELPDWNLAKRVSIDTETFDPYLKQLGPSVRRGGFIAGTGITLEDGPSAYLPVAHKGGGNMDPSQVWAYLRYQAKNFRGQLVGANLSYDLDYLAEKDVHFPNVQYFRDIQIADPLIYELHDSFSLDNIAKRNGFPGKDEVLLREAARAFGVDPKSGMWQLPAEFVGTYCEVDTQQPLLVLRKQELRIDEEDLWNVYNLESKVLPVLVRMRRRGIRVDLKRLAEIEDWSIREEEKQLAIASRESGVKLNVGDVWQAAALAPALRAIGIELNKTAAGADSIDKEFLKGVDHPVAKAIAEARKVNKIRTTFAASVRKYMTGRPGEERIHCTFSQIAREEENGDQKGARYGRLACSDPNLQQQPGARSGPELANMWRAIYLPEDGCKLAAPDYSQQEPRWTTHFAGECNLPGAQVACQAYHDDPKLDNHDFMAKLTGLKRSYAKNIFLGLCYGEGGAKLCRDCGLPTRWALSYGQGRERKTDFYESKEEAFKARGERGEGYAFETAGVEGQKIIDAFDERAPYIRKLAKKATDRAKAVGHITTAGGRKLHFPQRQDGSYDWTHKALNRLIQGTSADQMKKALVALDREGFLLALQVHDEAVGSVRSEAEALRMADIMKNIMPARVPFRVDVEVGPNWGSLRKVDA